MGNIHNEFFLLSSQMWGIYVIEKIQKENPW